MCQFCGKEEPENVNKYIDVDKVIDDYAADIKQICRDYASEISAIQDKNIKLVEALNRPNFPFSNDTKLKKKGFLREIWDFPLELKLLLFAGTVAQFAGFIIFAIPA